MADYLFANNVSTTLNGAILSTDTTITVADGSVFPTPATGKTLLATLIKSATSQVEIVEITAISTNDLTIVRAQESTTALACADGDTIEMRITKGMLESFQLYQEIEFPISSGLTDAETGEAPLAWRPKYDYRLHEIILTAYDAPTGSTAEVDMNEDAMSILSTVVSIDAGENTSTTAATPAAISNDEIDAGKAYTFDIDQVGATNPGKGYWVKLIVSRR